MFFFLKIDLLIIPQLLNSKKKPPRTCNQAQSPPLGMLPASRTLCLLFTGTNPPPSTTWSS